MVEATLGDDRVGVPASASSTPDVVIVGGGAVGVSAALALARRGARVELLERGPELAHGCSSGNAGIVGAAHVIPLAGPGPLRDGLRWMGRRDSPFALRPSPQLAPWLARFVAESAPWRVKRAHAVLRAMALTSAELHADLADEGLDTGYARRGLLNVYASTEALAAARREAEADRADGLANEVLDAEALRGAFPGLAGTPAGGVHYPHEAHCDPKRYVEAVGAAAVEHGVRVRTGVDVTGFRTRAGRVEALSTTEGDVHAGQVVLAAGVWSPGLLRDLELRIPVTGGKGYHLDLPSSPFDPQLPVWFQEQRVVVTPLGDRLRVAGTLELAGLDERIDPRRLQAVHDAARRGLRGLTGREVVDVWSGLRPCTPDGLPIVGRTSRLPNLMLATGHGMWGLQLGPVTGQLVAQLAVGATRDERLAPLTPGRFGARAA